MSDTASQRVLRSNGRALVGVAGPGCYVGCGGQTRKGNLGDIASLEMQSSATASKRTAQQVAWSINFKISGLASWAGYAPVLRAVLKVKRKAENILANTCSPPW